MPFSWSHAAEEMLARASVLLYVTKYSGFQIFMFFCETRSILASEAMMGHAVEAARRTTRQSEQG